MHAFNTRRYQGYNTSIKRGDPHAFHLGMIVGAALMLGSGLSARHRRHQSRPEGAFVNWDTVVGNARALELLHQAAARARGPGAARLRHNCR